MKCKSIFSSSGPAPIHRPYIQPISVARPLDGGKRESRYVVPSSEILDGIGLLRAATTQQ